MPTHADLARRGGIRPESLVWRSNAIQWQCIDPIPDKEMPMPNDLAALGLDKLSVQERLDLIETLWDSLPD